MKRRIVTAAKRKTPKKQGSCVLQQQQNSTSRMHASLASSRLDSGVQLYSSNSRSSTYVFCTSTTCYFGNSIGRVKSHNWLPGNSLRQAKYVWFYPSTRSSSSQIRVHLSGMKRKNRVYATKLLYTGRSKATPATLASPRRLERYLADQRTRARQR